MKIVSKIFKYTFGIFLLLLIISIITMTIILEPKIKISNWEVLDANKLTHIERTISLTDGDDNIINEFIYDNNKMFTPISQIPQKTLDAFISIEDKRFYKHNGVDYIRIGSAFKNNIKARSFKEGASTISQQLIKNTHLTNEKSISRKVQEIRITKELERKYTKSEILEMYLNILYFGNNIYGIGTAASEMFEKNISDLTVSESALLAGMINNPNRYNPYTNIEKSIGRRNLVLKQMLKNNKITREEYEIAINEVIDIKKITNENSQYINNVIKEASEILMCDEKKLFSKNLIIGTNLDSGIQTDIKNILSKINITEDVLAQIIIINNKTGNIESIISNTDKNLAYIKRQPGSTIKPVLSFAPALEKNIIVPMTQILDTKTKFGDYCPSNYNDKYEGWTSVQNCLSHSSNICAIKLLEMNGIEYSKRIANNCGLTFSQQDNTLPIALGGLTDGFNLKEIANAYQVFANDGKKIDAKTIRYIKNADGKYLYKQTIDEKKAISPETAFFINEMLSDCAKNGTAKRLNGLKNVCAKTGTVGDKDGNTDAYCIAYNTSYTVAVWIGSHDNNTKNKINGGGTPAILAKQVLENLTEKNPASSVKFNKPNSIIEVDILISELTKNHKLVAAGDEVFEKDKIKAYFTNRNAPKRVLDSGEYKYIDPDWQKNILNKKTDSTNSNEEEKKSDYDFNFPGFNDLDGVDATNFKIIDNFCY